MLFDLGVDFWTWEVEVQVRLDHEHVRPLPPPRHTQKHLCEASMAQKGFSEDTKEEDGTTSRTASASTIHW